MFKIYDGRDKLYQWDIDRKLIVEDNTIEEVHFCNRTDSCSLVCETYQKNGLTLVNIPNILLQSNWKIHVYAYSGYTKYEDILEVVSRTKPADYVYIETFVKTQVGKRYYLEGALKGEIFNDYDTNEASGLFSHAEGSKTKANGIYSHAEGVLTTADGMQSHAEGSNTMAIGAISHAEGYKTEAHGIHAHAEGRETKAIGDNSHAEGWITEAHGDNSHAEGYQTKALNRSAHAEGRVTEAHGDFSHAEGISTKAYGIASHVEGRENEAHGYAAHAEGRFTRAKFDFSHAEGLGTVTASIAQHVSGKYNDFENQADKLVIVGNGNGDTARGNAYTLDINGNAEFSGTVESDGIILSSQAGNKFKICVNDDGTLIITSV